MIFERHPVIVYCHFLFFLVANILIIPFRYLAIKASARMLASPRISYAGDPYVLYHRFLCHQQHRFRYRHHARNGGSGYFLETTGYPVAPIVLGLVLGPILEQNFMTSMIKLDWDLPLFSRGPLAPFWGLTVLIWFFPLFAAFLEKTKKKTNGQVQ